MLVMSALFCIACWIMVSFIMVLNLRELIFLHSSSYSFFGACAVAVFVESFAKGRLFILNIYKVVVLCFHNGWLNRISFKILNIYISLNLSSN